MTNVTHRPKVWCKSEDAMSLDLTVLAAAVLWGFLQIVLAARAANWQHGLRWACEST